MDGYIFAHAKFSSMSCVFKIILFLSLFDGILTTWTKFDLVRTRLGAWNSNGNVPFIKFNSFRSGLNINGQAEFGSSVANIGDLNKDGIDDIVVGAAGEGLISNTTSIISSGGLYILFLNSDGNLKAFTHINSTSNGGPSLLSGDRFGHSVASAGDLDADSVPDIIVGAPGKELSAVYILFMNSNGSVKSWRRIRGTILDSISSGAVPNGPPIRYGSRSTTLYCS